MSPGRNAGNVSPPYPRGAKKPLSATGRGAVRKGDEGQRARKSLSRISGDSALQRRADEKIKRVTAPLEAKPDARVTKTGYKRICLQTHFLDPLCLITR